MLRTAAILILCLGCPMPAVRASQAVVGGYSSASTKSEDVMKAATFAVAAQQKAVNAKGKSTPVNLELVKVLSAESQVVAGTNFRLQLRVKVNGEEQKAEAIVWWQPWRKPNPYELTAWSAK